jgi:hypothetical protein
MVWLKAKLQERGQLLGRVAADGANGALDLKR